MPSETLPFPIFLESILEGQPDRAEFTLQSVVEASDRLSTEAREALPYNFDECSYAKGPLRQAIFSCMDCGEKGVCYSCSITCHGQHRLVELWTKRDFRCDCPTEAMCAPGSSRTPAGRTCKLNPPTEQPQPVNDANRYSKNFAGDFCRCGRDYDAATETEAMVNCIACEDWLHESCLNLQPRRTEEPDEELEDDEADCLIPSDTYDGLVCAACVSGHPLLRERAGTKGWMIIEPDAAGGWKVSGRPAETGETPGDSEPAEPAASPAAVKRALESDEQQRAKKARVDGTGEGTESAAKPKGSKKEAEMKEGEGASADATSADAPQKAEDEVEDSNVGAGAPAGDATAGPAPPAAAPPAAAAAPPAWAGDIFLGKGVRAALNTELDAAAAAALPFPLVDAEIYQPPEDDVEPETMDQVTDRAISALPRVQAIETVRAYQAMKERIQAMMLACAASGRSVSKDDVDACFAQLRRDMGVRP